MRKIYGNGQQTLNNVKQNDEVLKKFQSHQNIVDHNLKITTTRFQCSVSVYIEIFISKHKSIIMAINFMEQII